MSGGTLGNEELAEHICSLATRIAAATCTFLLAVAEYDRREAWQEWECRSMTHWLSWKCAISPITASQYCRTAAALLSMPRIRAEFAQGRLSYSQVRAISRVATPDTEEFLVSLARSMTAAQIERLTSAYHRCRAAAEQQAEDRDRRRTLQWGFDDDGMLTGTFRLAPEDGALLVKAVSERQAAYDPTDMVDDHPLDPVGALRADALCDLIRTDLDRQEHEVTDSGDRFLVSIVTEPAVISPNATNDTMTGSDAAIDGLCQLAGGPGLAPSTIHRLLCDQPTVHVAQDPEGNALDVGRRTRRISRSLRRALAHRDGHCRFPGCLSTRTDAHHVVHWIDGGPTSMDNLISLCSRHHHRHHQGGFTIVPERAGRFTFTLPNGMVLTEVGSIDGPLHPAVTLPAPPDPYACAPDWDGSGVDLPWVVGVLWDTEHPPTADLSLSR